MCVDSSSEWGSKRFASQLDVRELNRIYALVDPRPSTSSDADAASIAECRRIWRKRTGVQHGPRRRRALGVHMPALRNRLSRPRRWIGFSVGAEAVALGGGSDCITAR